ncbi:hypothetical protein JM79_0002 [Gramella sp. Hel_I_59]|nr:hypothetical protein [Gramella sp. Hel_I_59]TQI69135.1 hypothetical protein JM79_0002 [Gramella sp. Hel_I_59]
MSFAGQKSGVYKALFLLEKGLAISEIINNGAKGIAIAKANHAAVPAVIPGTILPNPTWMVSLQNMLTNVASVKLNTGLQLAEVGMTTLKGVTGFEKGKYPDYMDVTRTDGKRFRARNMGNAGTRIVNEPTYFRDNDYLTGENGTEMIIDNAVFRQLDPRLINEILYTRQRVKGFEGGMYKNPAAAGMGQQMPTSDPELKAMLLKLMLRLDEPIDARVNWGYDEAEKDAELKGEIDSSKNNGKITS